MPIHMAAATTTPNANEIHMARARVISESSCKKDRRETANTIRQIAGRAYFSSHPTLERSTSRERECLVV